MKAQFALFAAVALAMPVQAIAEPICPALKAAQAAAESDKFMASLKTGPEEVGKWAATRQVDGFKCVITTGSNSGMVRGFYSCTWAGSTELQPVNEAKDVIGACLGVDSTIEKSSSATRYLFNIRPTPRMWVALSVYNGRPFSFSLIAE